jgi:hypothetical protein
VEKVFILKNIINDFLKVIDDKYLIIGGLSKIKVYDLESGKCLIKLKIGPNCLI